MGTADDAIKFLIRTLGKRLAFIVIILSVPLLAAIGAGFFWGTGAFFLIFCLVLAIWAWFIIFLTARGLTI